MDRSKREKEPTPDGELFIRVKLPAGVRLKQVVGVNKSGTLVLLDWD